MFTNGLHKTLGRCQAHKTLCDANRLKTIMSEQAGCIDTYTVLIHFFRKTVCERTGHEMRSGGGKDSTYQSTSYGAPRSRINIHHMDHAENPMQIERTTKRFAFVAVIRMAIERLRAVEYGPAGVSAEVFTC